MNLSIENILLIGSILLFISILAGKTSHRFGVPTLVFFLVIGMLAGSDGIGGILFSDISSAHFIGVVALNFILFSGGFDTNWQSTKPVLWQGVVLSTLGVCITALLVGLVVCWATDFTLYEGLLLGSIVSSTDAAAVFSVLRSRNLALKYNLRSTLELESGSNDPVAYFLTISFLGLVQQPDTPLLTLIPNFLQNIALGLISGYLLGKLGHMLINRIELEFEALYPVLIIALMFFTYSITDFIHGNGFLAVYICGIYLGNKELIHKKTTMKVFDGFAWLMQIILFLTLGLLVYPSEIVPVLGVGLILSAFLIFVARPVAVFISLWFFKVKTRSKWFISWVGLRGAVPIVFAIYPLMAGIDKANEIFNIVFFVSLTSVFISGTTLAMVARWFQVDLPAKAKARSVSDMRLMDSIKSELTEVELPEYSPAIGRAIVNIGFPPTTSISIIKRDGKYLTPSGSTVLEEKDKLLLLAENKEGLNQVYDLLGITEEEGKG